MLVNSTKTTLDFILTQLKKVSKGVAIDELPLGFDDTTIACYKELIKVSKLSAASIINEPLPIEVNQLLNTIDATIVIYNPSKNVVMYNQAYEKIFAEKTKLIKPNTTIYDVLAQLYNSEYNKIGLTKDVFINKYISNFGLREVNDLIEVNGAWYSRTKSKLTINGYVTTFNNVTNLKNEIQSLESNKTNLSLAIDSSKQAILMFDKLGKVIFVNKTVNFYTQALGFKNKIEKGHFFFPLLREPLNTYFENNFKKALGNEIIEHEKKINTPFGAIFFFITYTPIKATSNEINGVSISFLMLQKSEQCLNDT